MNASTEHISVGSIYGTSGTSLVNDKTLYSIEVLDAESFDGEYNKQPLLYFICVWFVGIMAMFNNIFKAIFLKIFTKKRKMPFRNILWEMGRDEKHFSSIFMDKHSWFNHLCKVRAASSEVLDLFYNYWDKIYPTLGNDVEGICTKFWISRMENRQAVTNRKKIAVDILVDAFKKFINEPEVRLMSVASGSAQAVMEAMQICSQLNIKVILIDKDQRSLEIAKENAIRMGILDKFEFIQGTTRDFPEVAKRFKPQIVEIMGLFDYLTQQKAIKLSEKVYNALQPGGIFLTCNIRNNPEKIFLDWSLLWPMIYRNEKQLADMVLGGGFNFVDLYYEPFKIHGIAYARK